MGLILDFSTLGKPLNTTAELGGKTAEYHSRTQEEKHELLMSFAEVGATFVRLKGGDRAL